MPATVTHALSMTTPFDALFENNATDWNSAHAITFNVNATEISQIFSNANGVTFGLDGTNITASVAAGAGITNINVSAGTTSNNLSAFTLADSNGISFGLNGSVVTGTVATNYMASNLSSNFAGVGETVGTIAGTDLAMTVDTAGVSIGYPKWITTQSGQAFSADASSTFQTLSFQDSNGISFSNNAGGLRVTHGLQFTSATSAITSNAMHSTSRPAFSADASSTFQTLSFQNSNGVTFSNNAGAIRASVVTSYRASNDAVGLNTAQTNVTWTVNSAGLSFNASGYAGTALTFNVTNLTTSITYNSAGLNLSINNLDDHFFAWELEGVNTAGTTGTTLTTEAAMFFSGGPNITLSGNSNTIVISGPAAGGTTHYTVSEFMPFGNLAPITNSTLGQSTLYFAPFDVPVNVSASRINFYLSLATTWSAANTRSCSARLGYALYTRSGNGSQATLSRLTSYECPFIILSGNSSTIMLLTMYNGLSNETSHSTLQSIISNVSVPTFLSNSVVGYREIALPMNLTLTPGRYWLGVSNQTQSSNNSAILSVTVLQQHISNQLAFRQFGTSSAASNASFFGAWPGFGTYSAVSAAWPASIPLSSDSIRVAPVGTIPYFNISGYSTSLGVL